jgi:hypothetical protein
MCTLTFVPTVDGYLAGMNRDELLARPAALPPQAHEHNGITLVYPQEPSGGTWVACNGHGNLLALLNWNEIDPSSLGAKRKTRGLVIPAVLPEENSSSTSLHLKCLTLEGVFPFRLIGVFPVEKKVIEWRWDSNHIQQLEWPWVRRHWFSSSLSDERAATERGRLCEAAGVQAGVGSTEWLGRLHRLHEPKPGPYSICVHRPDAATVSCTEVECGRTSISMKYLSGSPCLKDNFDELIRVNLIDSQAARHFA